MTLLENCHQQLNQLNMNSVISKDNFEVERSYNGHEGSVNTVRFSKDGNYIMTASDDRSVKLFNPFRDQLQKADSNRGIFCIKSYEGFHNYPIYDIAISSDNSKFVSGGKDKTVFIVDVSTGNVIRRMQGHNQKINSVAFNNDNTTCLSASDDQTLRVWDLRSSSHIAIQSMNDFKDSVSCITQADGSILGGCVDGSVHIYDIRKGLVYRDDIKNPITSICMLFNEKSYVAMCLGGYIRLIDISSGQILNEYHSFHTHNTFKSQAVLSNDDKYIISGSEDGAIYQYDFFSAKCLSKFQIMPESTNPSVIASISFHPTKPYFASGQSDGSVKVVQLLS